MPGKRIHAHPPDPLLHPPEGKGPTQVEGNVAFPYFSCLMSSLIGPSAQQCAVTLTKE